MFTSAKAPEPGLGGWLGAGEGVPGGALPARIGRGGSALHRAGDWGVDQHGDADVHRQAVDDRCTCRNSIHAVQTAYEYSWRTPPSRCLGGC